MRKEIPIKSPKRESPKTGKSSVRSKGKNSAKSKGRSKTPGKRGDVDMADAEEEKLIITTPYSARSLRQANKAAKEAQ